MQPSLSPADGTPYPANRADIGSIAVTGFGLAAMKLAGMGRLPAYNGISPGLPDAAWITSLTL